MDAGTGKIEQRRDLGTEELCRQLKPVLPVRDGPLSPQIDMDIPQIGKHPGQLGNLARHSWGTVGAQLRHSWGTKLKTFGHSWGTAGA